MDTFYLTENIIIENDKTFYIRNKHKLKITNSNWHIYLGDFGWEKLPISWIKKLNSLSIKKEKNSRYALYDCEMDGNCFFQCIANSFNNDNKLSNYNYEDIRNLIADGITNEMFEELIMYYRIICDSDDFDEEWDPYKIDNINDFKDQIRESGNNYWCDYILLNYVIIILNINIIILNYNKGNKDSSIYNTLFEYDSKKKTIFLFYEENIHFKLIGYYDNTIMKSTFEHSNIPYELKELMDLK